ncbi:hypothetical protein PUN28_014185 [Cardiocondyla obscurior]|uniref:Uncharacterized protein n=1 Tax=Cardiocondyla obscurior TaxID=286306 RepID=A0AAW2F3U0_9HYME
MRFRVWSLTYDSGSTRVTRVSWRKRASFVIIVVSLSVGSHGAISLDFSPPRIAFRNGIEKKRRKKKNRN